MSELISILMPVKNAEQWLEETLTSIQKQKVNWELIAIDDHSIDASITILEEFSLKDSRIKVYKNHGSGIIPALQQALSLSSGIYITRMDADDIMPDKRLSTFLHSFKNGNGKRITTGMVKYFSEDLVSEGYLKYERWLNNRVLRQDHYQHIYRECVVASPNWFALKSDLITDKIFEQLNYPEDYHMTFLWKRNDYLIECISDLTLMWREHPSRTSRTSDVYQQDSFFKLKLDYFIQDECQNGTPIAIIGWGKKGKLVAAQLAENSVPFNIYDLDFNKYKGHESRFRVHDPMHISESKALVCIYPDDLNSLETFLHKFNLVIGQNAWYV